MLFFFVFLRFLLALFFYFVCIFTLVNYSKILVLLPAFYAIKLFDKFRFFFRDSNAVPMIPLLAVVTTTEIKMVSIIIGLETLTHIMNRLTSVPLQMQYRVSPSSLLLCISIVEFLEV